jgi:hypothetical protein
MVGELPNHIELIYKNAEDNLRFIKQQQWSIARYAVTAYGALFVVAKTIRAECADKVLLVLAAWLVAVFSVLILWSLIESMATFRGRIAWVYASYFRSEKIGAPLVGHEDLVHSATFSRRNVKADCHGHHISLPALRSEDREDQSESGEDRTE